MYRDMKLKLKQHKMSIVHDFWDTLQYLNTPKTLFICMDSYTSVMGHSYEHLFHYSYARDPAI